MSRSKNDYGKALGNATRPASHGSGRASVLNLEPAMEARILANEHVTSEEVEWIVDELAGHGRAKELDDLAAQFLSALTASHARDGSPEQPDGSRFVPEVRAIMERVTQIALEDEERHTEAKSMTKEDDPPVNLVHLPTRAKVDRSQRFENLIDDLTSELNEFRQESTAEREKSGKRIVELDKLARSRQAEVNALRDQLKIAEDGKGETEEELARAVEASTALRIDLDAAKKAAADALAEHQAAVRIAASAELQLKEKAAADALAAREASSKALTSAELRWKEKASADLEAASRAALQSAEAQLKKNVQEGVDQGYRAGVWFVVKVIAFLVVVGIVTAVVHAAFFT
jgi:hypothetical protein